MEAPSETTNHDDSDDDEYSDMFQSLRTKTGLEIGLQISNWPQLVNGLELTTCLPPTALAPMFDGTQWAGTRVWRAAVVATQYLQRLGCLQSCNNNNNRSLLELGSGLGVPGMLLHALTDCRTVLSDKGDLLHQLQANIQRNFPHSGPRITAMALDWEDCTAFVEGSPCFDVILNCDCIYQPLYGESWKSLLELQRLLLQKQQNQPPLMITSVERRKHDGIDRYLQCARENKGLVVEQIALDFDHGKAVELYQLRLGTAPPNARGS